MCQLFPKVRAIWAVRRPCVMLPLAAVLMGGDVSPLAPLPLGWVLCGGPAPAFPSTPSGAEPTGPAGPSRGALAATP